MFLFVCILALRSWHGPTVNCSPKDPFQLPSLEHLHGPFLTTDGRTECWSGCQYSQILEDHVIQVAVSCRNFTWNFQPYVGLAGGLQDNYQGASSRMAAALLSTDAREGAHMTCNGVAIQYIGCSVSVMIRCMTKVGTLAGCLTNLVQG
jgi:hypothetical protein